MERRQFLVAAPASLLAAGGVAQSAAASTRSNRGSLSVSSDAQDALALYRWALGFDSHDIGLMRSAFTQDVRFIFRPVGGVGQPTIFEGIDAVMKLFTDSFAAQKTGVVTSRPTRSSSASTGTPSK